MYKIIPPLKMISSKSSRLICDYYVDLFINGVFHEYLRTLRNIVVYIVGRKLNMNKRLY
jgi:hypothetical protein